MKPIIFLIPVTALLIVITLYILLLKKVADKKIFKRFFLIMTLSSFILNEVWELVQMPLYEQPIYKIGHIAFCTLAALADMIMVLLLYVCFGFIYKNPGSMNKALLPIPKKTKSIKIKGVIKTTLTR